MNANGITTKFPFKLSHSLQERKTFNISNRTSDFSDYKVIVPCCPKLKHPSLYLVRDVGNNLYGSTKIFTFAFTFDDGLINLARCDIIC